MSGINSTNILVAVNDSGNERGDAEKILAMVILGLGSFLAGIAPVFISDINRRRFPLSTSILLCFGAGILLATALVHILPEARKQLTNFSEISLCAGFFIIYFIDEFIHYFFGEAIQHQHRNTQAPSTMNNGEHYGALRAESESEPLLHHNSNRYSHSHYNAHSAENSCGNQSRQAVCDDMLVAQANARICHTSHTEPCAQSMTGTLGLFVALSLHSAVEGLAIGVQNSSAKVLFLLGAVACHKFVMGFCLGLEFLSNPQTSLRSHAIGIMIFALGAVCGIVIGMIIVDIPSGWSKSALPIIQALAGGTLFYVTVCEVIPREKARWHQNSVRKFAGFAQFFAVLCGFAVMCVINFYIGDDDN